MENVDWGLIADATKYYQSNGFGYIETPWVTSIDSLKITCPMNENIYTVGGHGNLAKHLYGGLVGSAEQGFIELSLEDKIQVGRRYVSAGPCFRNETVDKLHQTQFFKVELFCKTNEQEKASAEAKHMLSAAYSYMVLKSPVRPEVVDEGHGWDIIINDIEVGSYGYRYHEDIGYWAYGTGLAEPRFTQALELFL